MNSLLLAAALLGAPNLESVQQQTVTLEMPDNSSGSGIVIDGKRVLTAKHVVGEAKSGFILKTNGCKIPFNVVKVSKDYDLAMVELVGAKLLVSTKFDTDIKLGVQVWHCGGWLGFDRADSISTGIVSKLSGDYIQTTTFAIYGSSGGGIWDEDGECVALVSKILIVPPSTPFDTAIPLPVNYCIPSKTLVEFINE